MNRWIPCELHTHTIHSDGQATLLELGNYARELGYECIALTDHNTISGNKKAKEISKTVGVEIIEGLEWTTFYGHMVILGAKKYIDWRTKGIGDIKEGIDEAHKVGGIVGIAHPYHIGSPICSGCHWKYEMNGWLADYLEVWSGTFPALDPLNQRAFDKWTELLNQGIRVVALSGRDWHGESEGNELVAPTYLEIDENQYNTIEEGVVDAITRGKVSVSMGPLVTFDIKSQKGQLWAIGDDAVLASYEKVSLEVRLDYAAREGKWQIDNEPLNLKIISNKGVITQMDIEKTKESINIPDILMQNTKWVRVELYGNMNGKNGMLAFTNPIYIK